MSGRGWELASLGRPVAVVGWCGVAVAGLIMASPTLVLGSLIGAACTLHSSSVARRRREVRTRRSDLIDAVDAIVHRLKTGGSLASALAEQQLALPILDGDSDHRAGLDTTATEPDSRPERAAPPLSMAVSAPLTIPSLASLSSDPDNRLLVTTLSVLNRRGGRALPSLERLSDTLRSGAALALETEAQAGQATASALALAALPGLFVVALAIAQDALRQFYLYDLLGAACLLSAAALSYIGWAVMQHLIDSAR